MCVILSQRSTNYSYINKYNKVRNKKKLEEQH